MRVLKVEFENINSLKGQWTIDFTDKSFSDNHNLFVICGPTGSGKTSILDAISLGLYGKTPRQSLINKGNAGNEVMSYGTAVCFSRVTYSCSKGIYTSEFVQRRARNNPSGNLQDAEYSITDVTSDKIVSSGSLRTFEKETERIIGLSYEQFLRSIMLAQGDFSKFLKSEPNERALILEKLTGTEKYRKFAEKLHERFTVEKSKLEALQKESDTYKGKIISDDDEKALRADYAKIEKQLKELENKRNNLNKLKNWYDNLNAASKNLSEAEIRKDTCEKKFLESSEDKLRLERGNKALECQSEYDIYIKSKSELESCKASLSSLKEEVSSLQEDYADILSKLTKSKESKLKLEAEFEAQRAVWSQVKLLDSNIASVYEQRKKLQEDCESFQKKIKLAREELQTEKQNKDMCSVKMTKAKSYLDLNVVDADIVETTASFDAYHKNLNSIYADYVSNKKKLDGYIADHESKSLSMEPIKKSLEKDKQYLTDYSRDKNLDSIIAIWTERERQNNNNLESLDKVCVELKEIEQVIETLDKEVQQKQSELLKAEEEYKVVAQKNGAIVAGVLRKLLQENQPCPVCGSLNHPSCSDNSTAVNVDVNASADAAKRITDASDRINTIHLQIKELEQKIIAEKNIATDRTLVMEEIQKKVKDYAEERSLALLPWGTDITLVELNKISFAYKDVEQSVLESSEKLTALEGELKLLESSIDMSRENIAKNRDSWITVFAEVQSIIAKYMTDSGFDDVKELSQEKIDAFKDVHKILSKRGADYQQNREIYDSASNELNRLDSVIQEKEKVLCDDEESFRIKTESFSDCDKNYQELSGQRFTVFGDKDPVKEESLLKSGIESETSLYEQYSVKEHDKAQEKNMREGQIKTLEENLMNHEKAVTQNKEKFDSRIIENGFTDEADYCKSVLTLEDRQSLESLINKINTDCVEAKASYDAAQKVYEDIKAQETSPEPEENIISAISDTESKYDILSKDRVSISIRLSQNDENKESVVKILESYKTQSEIFKKWETVKNWIGDKDGKAFSVYVQSLAFPALIRCANSYLEYISPRYSLCQKDSMTLDFELMDTNYLNPRSVSNISGGESFQVSLALALGIAKFASSSVKVDSLFIDEGFGTLDHTIKDKVIDTLKTLQQSGKTIGIITHVDDVIKEFPQQIRIEPIAGSGYSTIKGEGISSCIS